jgi:hypothetical protein
VAKAKQLKPEHFAELPLEDRVLIFLADRDRERGRGDPCQIISSDAANAILISSSSRIHWSFEVLANTASWSELREYASESDPTVKMPLGHKALAVPTPSLRQRYNNLFKRLVAKKEMYAFTESFRAVQGLGGTRVPMLSLWANIPKPQPISAVSLTESGFERASALSQSFSTIRPWQLHEFIVTVPGFLQKLQGGEA